MSRKSLALCIVFCLASPLLAEEQAYPIHLLRPDQKGHHVSVECVDGEMSGSEIRWEGFKNPVVEDEAYAVRLVADYETREVDSHGHELVGVATVRACTKTTDGGETQLLAPGTRIVARVGSFAEGTNLRINGEVPTTELARALGLIIHIGTAEEVDGFELTFGSATPRKAGESWPIDASKAAEMFVANGTNVLPTDISGTTRFVGVERCEGIECFHFEYDSKVKHYYSPPPPSGALTTRPSTTKSAAPPYTGTLTTHSVWFAPIDPSADSPRRSTEWTLRYVDEGSSNGVKFHRQMIFKRQFEMRTINPTTQP